MNKFTVIAAATLATFALAVAQPASAKGKGQSWKAAGDSPSGFKQGRKLGWAQQGRPPGWSKGRKTGWHGATMPPGFNKPAKLSAD